jgi:hypothetical protein
MNNSISRLCFFILLLSLSACGIQEEIRFNKDFSGQMTRSLNFSGMRQMAKSMNPEGDTTENPFEQGMPEGASPELDIEGISNFKMEVNEEGIINLSFEFDNIEALNKAYNNLTLENMKNMPGLKETMGSGGFTPGELPEEEEKYNQEKSNKDTKPKADHIYFARKGKNFFYYPMSENIEENPEVQGMGLDNIGDMFKFETKLVFDNKIKKVSNTSPSVETFTDESTNTLTMEMKIDGKKKTDKPAEIKIKLK